MKITTSFLTLLLFTLCQLTFAENENWSVSLIPQDLKKDADCILRSSIDLIKVKSSNKKTAYHKRVYTVLNEKGQSKANFIAQYDKFSSISSCKCRIFDAQGKEVRKLKSSDFRDYSATDQYTLFDDSRAKVYEFNSPVFPVTIEYEWEESCTGIGSYARWYPVQGNNFSVEKAVLTIEIPNAFPFRFKNKNIDIQPLKEEKEKGMIRYTWELKNYQALKPEAFCPVSVDIFPMVYADPAVLDYDNTKIDISSWKENGKRLYELYETRNALPLEIANKMLILKNNHTDKLEIIKEVHKILAEKTRYVSIQLGIGGWIPFSAETVEQKGYGDCKALSNYARVLLKHAGVDSYPVIIHAGEQGHSLMDDYSSMTQADHVILGIPNGQDTIYMECTNPLVPLGFMGTFTADRKALMITPNGGKLVYIPLLKETENSETRNSKVKLSPDGVLDISSNTSFKGYQADDRIDITRLPSKEQTDHFLEGCTIQSPKVVSLQYQYKEDRNPTVTETVNLETNTTANVNGKRIFMPVNLFSYKLPKLLKEEERKFPIKIRYGNDDVENYDFTLPEGYHPEALPESQKIESPFGTYEIEVNYNQGKVSYSRHFLLRNGLYPASEYEKFVAFLNKVTFLDKAKMVLIKD
ncbi:MAG: DUF3857 domain-containing protein [Bacteroidota bacterium]|nr:DUF3857 domain-containing protein [Bacteroidota bacterium]